MSEPPIKLAKKAKPPNELTLVDQKFLSYGGAPEAVDNWQAIALAALDIVSELAVGHPKSQGIERRK